MTSRLRDAMWGQRNHIARFGSRIVGFDPNTNTVIPDGRQADPGPRGGERGPWVPALRCATAGMT
ncbi:MAG: hypothetical protein Q8N10_06335 [Phenylobacterium sp.]|jgi:hypothetical protein|uniref:hypothetical protein n=1 Tax=Phenylobacterium sp. TaxID=1871053 RepID=UPI002721F3AE|nr:hypothetical protein [Phenylobacterium sp.]MDO8913256.1 hypothetical protein [Phenylobacterium sp.]MDP3100100.1 hypothetical protein [Phenylobacterium sp.]